MRNVTPENILAALNRRHNLLAFDYETFKLDMNNPKEKIIADAIMSGFRARAVYRDMEQMEAFGCIENIPGIVKLETMAQYGIVDLNEVFEVIKNTDKKEEPACHDAY